MANFKLLGLRIVRCSVIATCKKMGTKINKANHREGRTTSRARRTQIPMPSALPKTMPRKPIMQPCKTNIIRIFIFEEPIDLRIPISRVFSITIIINVLAILKEATRMIKASIMTVTNFSNWIASKRAACDSTQVLVLGTE